MDVQSLQRSAALLLCASGLLLTACKGDDQTAAKKAAASPAAVIVDNCSGTWPSYWQDPAQKFAPMWAGQEISNVPPADWSGPVFRLSDRYPRQPVDDKAAQKWRDGRFDALFTASTPAATKKQLAYEYGWLVMDYIQQGNVNRPGMEDWDVCSNSIRPWFSIPFQTYDAMSGREFTHGLTREAPVTFSTPAGNIDTTMWAVGFFNATAAYTLGTVWQQDGNAVIPQQDVSFHEGAVVGKPLFNTATEKQLPVLAHQPAWQANISDPSFCHCTPAEGNECTLIEESQQCPRSTTEWGPVRLLQFDFAVKDSRAPGTQWVFGTFVADGQRKADEADPWKRISLLGVMWGNDTPPAGGLAYDYPPDVKSKGFAEEVIFWDTVDELNKYGGDDVMKRMGHLGCNFRLNGPADNANSSCMSCHGTASVPDNNVTTPPLLSQFSGNITHECVTPDATDLNTGTDRSGAPANVKNGISFSAIDSIYFANVPAGKPFNMTVQTKDGPVNVMGDGVPDYGTQRSEWISLDYSLQLSISLTQWMQWQANADDPQEERIMMKEILRGE
ncbi:MAG: hypothetical protein KYX62_11165 [Pseudomonadota bacterium]|nr:hypothetical protein [Pseudomonadota bacterium]